MREVSGRKGGPLGVVNGTPWGGRSQPLGWFVGACGVVRRTPEGGASQPSGWLNGALEVSSRSQ